MQESPSSGSKATAIELTRQGEEQLADKKLGAAEAVFRQAVQADPGFGLAHRELGVTLWFEGHPEAAWSELSAAVNLDPDDAYAHYAFGQVARALAQPPGRGGSARGFTASDYQAVALAEIKRAVALRPRDFEMRLTLAEVFLSEGQKTAAQTAAKQAVELASSLTEQAEGHIALARALFAAGDEEGSEGDYKKALEEQPGSGSAYFGLGELRLSQHRTVEAKEYFEQAIHASPDMEQAYVELAKLLENTQPAEARSLYAQALALDPKDWRSQCQFAALLIRAGQVTQAKKILTAVIAQQPDFAAAREQLALMFLRQNDVSGAMSQGEALLVRNPQGAEGHRVLALAYWRQRQADQSLTECAEALAADPGSASMLALQAFVLWQQRHKNLARAALGEAAKVDSHILSGAVFCQLIACGNQDIPLVDAFLRNNRSVVATPPMP